MTQITDPILLGGAPGSPYTRKMLSLLRYRRLTYRYMIHNNGDGSVMPVPPVKLLPTFWFPDGVGGLQAVVDSTPIIRRLEREHACRSVLPPDPALAFLDELLEDYGDEWLTKAMFHYRWHYAEDIDRAGSILPRWRNVCASEAAIAPLKAQVSGRQISRLRFVGSNATTASVIEASYRRFLLALDALLQRQPFLMGQRPGASDFAIFGQLTQLTHFDPTPMALTLQVSPRVFALVEVMEDLSGLGAQDSDWLSRETAAQALGGLLAEVGRTYVPVMMANARALMAGADRVEAQVDGQPWVQQPFPYQGKCVGWLRQSWAGLPADDQAWLRGLLGPAGCLPLVGD